MKNYDDLQRFKDKTRTGDIHFKDLSAQNKQASSSSWAIINSWRVWTATQCWLRLAALRCPCRRPLSPANWMLLLPA